MATHIKKPTMSRQWLFHIRNPPTTHDRCHSLMRQLRSFGNTVHIVYRTDVHPNPDDHAPSMIMGFVRFYDVQNPTRLPIDAHWQMVPPSIGNGVDAINYIRKYKTDTKAHEIKGLMFKTDAHRKADSTNGGSGTKAS